MSAWHPVRVREAIAAEPFPEILGLAYVQNGVTRVTHQIHARAFWQLPKKVVPQPFDERLWIPE
jgi:hypothetical protein